MTVNTCSFSSQPFHPPPSPPLSFRKIRSCNLACNVHVLLLLIRDLLKTTDNKKQSDLVMTDLCKALNSHTISYSSR